jgi:hypothetical protein
MPVVDFESAWFALKAHIATKRSHGAGELAETMARIEVANRIPEMHQGYDDRPVHRHARVVTVPPADDDAALDAA